MPEVFEMVGRRMVLGSVLAIPLAADAVAEWEPSQRVAGRAAASPPRHRRTSDTAVVLGQTRHLLEPTDALSEESEVTSRRGAE